MNKRIGILPQNGHFKAVQAMTSISESNDLSLLLSMKAGWPLHFLSSLPDSENNQNH
jgi:hypothetical protein